MTDDFMDVIGGFAFCTIRPMIALLLVPMGESGSLGTALRVPFAFALALIPAHAGWPQQLLFASVAEAVVGAALGLLLSVPFHAAALAGALIDQQGGYTIAATYDPNFQEEAALFETLFLQFAVLVFFTGAGPRLVFGYFADAWMLWPPGGPYEDMTRVFSLVAGARVAQALAAGAQLAMPLIVLLLLVELSMGYVARHAKQMNPFAMARTLKIMALSLAAALSAPLVLARLRELFVQSLVQP